MSAISSLTFITGFKARALAVLFLAGTTSHAAEDLVDNWDDAPRVVTILVDGKPKFDRVETRSKQDYINKQIVLDFTEAKVGAFSLAAAKESVAKADGFAISLNGCWGNPWSMEGETVVSGWIRNVEVPSVTIALLNGLSEQIASATATIASADASGWRLFVARFRLPPVSVATLAVGLGEHGMGEVHLDGLQIHDAHGTKGITDRTVTEWSREAKSTLSARIRAAVEVGAGTDFSGRDRQLLDLLWMGRDIAKNNAELRELLRAVLNEHNVNHLPTKMRLIYAYYQLGSRSSFKPARLEPETEALILEILWEFTRITNDIAIARQSTWWITASENHDLNEKASALLTSRIFMNEPMYRERVYPDEGHGPGYGYWKASLADVSDGTEPTPGGNFKDGKQYRAAEHYAAWVKFFHEYYAERVRHGFFVENASPIYMKYTLSFLHAIHAYCGNEALKRETGAFLDLAWTDWAEGQIAGVKGGPKTRSTHSVSGYDSMTIFARFFLGGPGFTGQLYAHQLFDDYEWPDVIWDIALDTPGRGVYSLRDRGVGEAVSVRPRPAGFERTMFINPDSRLIKSSWVTPDYILGAQMDHPDATHTQLSIAARWQGLICAGDPKAHLVTVSSAKANGDADMDIVFQSVHARSTLITQQARRWFEIPPAWFGAPPLEQKPAAVFVGKAWDAIAEKGGWVFVKKGNAYGAVRVLAGARDGEKRLTEFDMDDDLSVEGNSRLVQIAEHPWKWSPDHSVMMLDDVFSPIVVEAGRKADYGDFPSFQTAVLSATVELLKTVVPGYYMVRYKGPAKDAEEIVFNAATTDIPLIAGQPVNYQLDSVFNGPFIHTAPDGTVAIKKGLRQLVLHFPAISK